MEITVNAVCIPFDVADWKDLEREEKAREQYKKAVESLNGLTGSAVIKKGCELIIKYFDDAFGKGTAHKVLGKETNFTKCAQAMTEAIASIAKMQTDYINAIKELELNVSAAKETAGVGKD